MIRDLILKNRTCRRFEQAHPIPLSALRALADLGRLSGSGGNMQPLAYVLCADARTNARIFPTLAWANYLKPWPGPAEGERPSAYIVMLVDTAISQGGETDAGIACQSMLLGATEQGLAGCMIGSVNRQALRAVLDIPERYTIMLVIALGKPAEKIVLEDVKADGSIRYWRDAQQVHHVPKRALKDIVVREIGPA
ncbi:MAG: nitroreductase family protein [Lentisphaerae bacterium]|nr:nitroreductase family protein [Lentisphaerota bacterium]